MLWLHNVSRKLWNVLIKKRVCHDFLHCTYFQHCERIVYLLQGRVFHEYVQCYIFYDRFVLLQYNSAIIANRAKMRKHQYRTNDSLATQWHDDNDPPMAKKWPTNDTPMTLKGLTYINSHMPVAFIWICKLYCRNLWSVTSFGFSYTLLQAREWYLMMFHTYFCLVFDFTYTFLTAWFLFYVNVNVANE
jgi:hypothetical protein